MAEIFPFRGFRFDSSKAGPLDDLVTQPYDKIPDALLQDYLLRSPHNVAHVIKNTDYVKAGRIFKGWLESELLRQDLQPAFYPYQQGFEIDGRQVTRLGFIGLVSLLDSDIGIRGHEKVLDAPLQDRLNLIRETESNDGLIFSLFCEKSMRIDQLLKQTTRATDPVAEVTDDFGVSHRLWVLEKAAVQREIAQLFRSLTVYIADGHHRFETARLFARECAEKDWSPAAVESFDKRMMAFFNMESPGLEILPTHRAIRDLDNLRTGQLLERLTAFFEVLELPGVEALDHSLKDSLPAIGLVTNDPFRVYCLRLKNEVEGFMPGVVGPARSLDVNILHQGILEPLLGIGKVELERQSHVDYFRDRAWMVDRVKQGRYQLAFVLNPTRLEQVREISERGEKMPQKSTDFFPKLLTGLVFMKMEIHRKDAGR